MKNGQPISFVEKAKREAAALAALASAFDKAVAIVGEKTVARSLSSRERQPA